MRKNGNAANVEIGWLPAPPGGNDAKV